MQQPGERQLAADRRHGAVRAVAGVDLDLRGDQVVALMGRNHPVGVLMAAAWFAYVTAMGGDNFPSYRHHLPALLIIIGMATILLVSPARIPISVQEAEAVRLVGWKELLQAVVPAPSDPQVRASVYALHARLDEIGARAERERRFARIDQFTAGDHLDPFLEAVAGQDVARAQPLPALDEIIVATDTPEVALGAATQRGIDAATAEMAANLAAKSPVAVQMGKEAIHRMADMTIPDALTYSNEMFASLCVTEDAREGVDAFLNKRKAVWKGC